MKAQITHCNGFFETVDAFPIDTNNSKKDYSKHFLNLNNFKFEKLYENLQNKGYNDIYNIIKMSRIDIINFVNAIRNFEKKFLLRRK